MTATSTRCRETLSPLQMMANGLSSTMVATHSTTGHSLRTQCHDRQQTVAHACLNPLPYQERFLAVRLCRCPNALGREAQVTVGTVGECLDAARRQLARYQFAKNEWLFPFLISLHVARWQLLSCKSPRRQPNSPSDTGISPVMIDAAVRNIFQGACRYRLRAQGSFGPCTLS